MWEEEEETMRKQQRVNVTHVRSASFQFVNEPDCDSTSAYISSSGSGELPKGISPARQHFVAALCKHRIQY